MTVTTFRGIPLETLPGRVMVPRETSVALAERVLAHIGDGPAVVADVGTGSGAIAIAIAEAAPNARVWATDDDPAAVALATRNAQRAGVGDRVHVRLGDLLDPVDEPLDAVVANLPYLPLAERDRHADLRAEPVHAVFAAGDGLEGYRRLLDRLDAWLRPGGLVAIQLRGRILTCMPESLAA